MVHQICHLGIAQGPFLASATLQTDYLLQRCSAGFVSKGREGRVALLPATEGLSQHRQR